MTAITPDPRVNAVIQARMSSARLPRKVLRPLCGKPVLWHVVHRLKQCETVDAVILATSDDPSDDALAAFADDIGIPCIRGPLENVLDRFRLALDAHPADYVVRMTGDCPLLDPGFIDLIVRALIAEGGDYLDVPDPEHSIHEGMDPVSAKAFRRLWQEVPDDPVAREHTTSYMKVHPDFAKLVMVDCPPEHRVTRPVRTSIDTPADLTFVETLYEKIGAPTGDLNLADVVRLVEAEPALLNINAHVRQRDATAGQRAVFIRYVTSDFGDVRALPAFLALGRAFRENLSWGVSVLADGAAADRFEADGFRVLRVPSTDAKAWFADLVGQERPDALVIGSATAAVPAELEGWQALGPPVGVFDAVACGASDETALNEAKRISADAA